MSMVSSVFSQISVERSVQLRAEADQDGFLTISWEPVNGATGYTVFLRNGLAWNLLETFTSSVTSYQFTGFREGQRYEFRVSSVGNRPGHGYIVAGDKVPLVTHRGRHLLLVEQSLAEPLNVEISRLIDDISGDGWVVDTMHVPMDMAHQDVKERIKTWYLEEPNEVNNVFILGHVAVPYSGEIAPDGHGNHVGAWPADGYYAEMNGTWEDSRVNNTTSADARNHNVPGDGKFDNSTIAGNLELELGRVDLFDMPAFSLDYVELTRQYLDKNHAFRIKEYDIKRRGLIENNFGSFAEGFGQNGWKNFAPMFGADSTFRGNYDVDLVDHDYLWAYACGGGSHTSMGGVGTTQSLYVEKEIQAVFVMNFGSYFGDWDRRNNLMRASLCSGKILTNAWAARPNWQFHNMALGDAIGSSTLASQNNSFVYEPGIFPRSVHVSLLGDPTLRLHTVHPPSSLAIQDLDGHLRLSWNNNSDATEGFLIWRKGEKEPRYELITTEPISDTTYIDSCLMANMTYSYMVKTIKLEVSASGTYYNSSVGSRVEGQTTTSGVVAPRFIVIDDYEEVAFQIESSIESNILWDFGDGNMSSEESPVHLYDRAGQYRVCLQMENNCGTGQTCDTIQVRSSMPDQVDFVVDSVTCPDGEDGQITAIVAGGIRPLTYSWNHGDMDSIANDASSGEYFLTITSRIGAMETYGPVNLDEPEAIDATISTTNSTGNDGTARADIMGGTPPYSLQWGDGNLDPNQLPPGMYELTVTDANDCTQTFMFEIKMATSVSDELSARLSMYPNPASDKIQLTWAGEKVVIHLQLINGNGQVVKSKVWKSTNPLEWVLDDLPEGFYLLKGETHEGVLMKSVVKQ